MKNLILEKAVSKDTAQSWMHSIFYMPYPDEEVIDAMFSLIESWDENRDPMFVLIPTSVVHTFCVNHNDCQEKPSVMRIIKYLEGIVVKHLHDDMENRKIYENMVVALKGLGNMGKTTKYFEDILKNLIVNRSFPVDIKLQAVNVFRKLNCERSRDFFVDMFRNSTESVEVRIASYLQAMKCPDYITIKTIKTALQQEEVKQVGSFVWSHLRNLAKSASPTQVQLQALLVDNKLNEKFNMDIRKYSRNYEYTLFFDEYNFGASGDSNLIFDTNSYLPRSLSFNGTVHLFGESINAVEFNVRMAGFESYVESIFGPKGPLNYDTISEKISSVIKYIKKMLNFDEEEILEKLIGRGKREVSEAILREMMGVKNIPYDLGYDYNHPHGYFEYKIFGNDINIFMFDGFKEFNEKFQDFISFKSLRNVLSGKEEVFTKSGTLLDMSYTVPLSTGIPLSLNGFGATSLDLRYSGSIKDPNVFNTKSLDFQGKIKPSLSLEFTGKMRADLFYAATEVKVKNNLYSNHAVEVDWKVEGTEKMSLKIILPQERNDIFSIRTKLAINKNDNYIFLSGIPIRNENSTCTWPSIDNALGLKLCIDYSVPDLSDVQKSYPSLILSGPINFDIHLDKADPTAKMFNFEYRWIKDNKESHGLFKFETPDSQVPRIFVTNVTSNHEGYNFLMGFQNGNNTHSAVGLYKKTSHEKRVNFALSINGKKQFSLDMGINKTDIKNGAVFYPDFYLIIGDQRVAGVIGTVKLTEKKNISQYDVNLQFETKKMQSTLNGYVIKSEASVNTKLAFVYQVWRKLFYLNFFNNLNFFTQFTGTKQETIELESSLANRSQRLRGKHEYEGSSKFASTAYPYLNFASEFRFLSSAMGHMETVLKINNAPDFVVSGLLFK